MNKNNVESLEYVDTSWEFNSNSPYRAENKAKTTYKITYKGLIKLS
jgi:hypothetical protein